MLNAVFDRVGGVRQLVNAFKSFVTVSAEAVGQPINLSTDPTDQSRRYRVRRSKGRGDGRAAARVQGQSLARALICRIVVLSRLQRLPVCATRCLF